MKRPPLLALTLAACGGGDGTTDAGPSVDAQAYFALQPGVCFNYASDAGNQVSLDIVPVESPPGVAIARSLSGVLQEKDYLVFDAGTVFLAERAFVPQGLIDVYDTPLAYLVAPMSQTALNSASSYTEADSAGMQTTGYETLVVSPDVNVQPWSGYGSSAGSDESKISFSFTNNDGGSVIFSWMTPELGFTDLFLADSDGLFVDYLLTGAHPDDAGCP